MPDWEHLQPLETKSSPSTYTTSVNIIKLKNTVNFPKHVFPCFPVLVNAAQLSKLETLHNVDCLFSPLSITKYCFFFLCLFLSRYPSSGHCLS